MTERERRKVRAQRARGAEAASASTAMLALAQQSPRWQNANPADGQRRCAMCGEVRPVEEFGLKDRASGQRRSYCDECYPLWRRERRLSREAGVAW